MSYDFSFLWPWLTLALLLGAGIGWMNWKRGPASPFFAGWLGWASIAWVVALVVAMLAWLPGRSGFWLETALFFLAIYVIGCLLGGWLKSAFAPELALIAPAPAKPAVPMPIRPNVSALVAPAAAPPPRPIAPRDPPAAPAIANEKDHDGARPPGFVTPRQGGADDLKRIRGIGAQNESRLHALGIWHFAQIAAWTHDNVRWVGSYLAFAGRIDREQWVEQARLLARGAETAFARRFEHGQIDSKLDDGTRGQANIADPLKIPPRK